jgi:AraC-like DNA-binding protein
MSGSFDARTTGEFARVAGQRVQLVPPFTPLRMRYTGAANVLIVAADISDLEGVADELLAPWFPDTVPLAGAGATLANVIRLLQTEAEGAGGLLAAGRGARHARQLLLGLLLDAAARAPTPAGSRSWYVKRAEEFMAANLGADIGIIDIARAASVSVRTLHDGFRGAHGTSPLRWLKQQRLDRVRAELVEATPAETSVTEVAMRWGIVHLSRFAAEYRARFGELPSQTLARC